MPDAYLGGLSYEDSERLWRDVLEGDDGCVFVAEDGGEVFGFSSGRPRTRFSRGMPEYRGKLQTIYVLPSHQGISAGGKLLGAVVRYFAERGVNSMLLWVFADNAPARRFYESLGGVLIGEDSFEIRGVELSEVAYGWRDLSKLTGKMPGADNP